jgi:hypothetical protein
MSKQWPAQTLKGDDCKSCLKKERGVFCHLHLDVSRPTVAAAASTPTDRAIAEQNWPAQTQKGEDCKSCLKKDRGVFCHAHSAADVSSTSSRPAVAASSSSANASKAATAERNWPALTTKGDECKLCLKRESGAFCHTHSGGASGSASLNGITLAAAATAATPSARKAAAVVHGWPAQTQKGDYCKNCLKKERGVFCTQHSAAAAHASSASLTPVAATTASASASASKTTAVERGWQALTAKGTHCKKCLQKDSGVFCSLHNSSATSSAVAAESSAAAAAAAVAASSSRDW